MNRGSTLIKKKYFSSLIDVIQYREFDCRLVKIKEMLKKWRARHFQIKLKTHEFRNGMGKSGDLQRKLCFFLVKLKKLYTPKIFPLFKKKETHFFFWNTCIQIQRKALLHLWCYPLEFPTNKKLKKHLFPLTMYVTWNRKHLQYTSNKYTF